MKHMPIFSSLDKWQNMQFLVNRYVTFTEFDYKKKFKKMVINRLLIGNILAFFLQFSGLMMSTLIIHPSPIWFASGTACALLFLKGIRILPGIYLASLIAYYLSNSGILLAILLAFLNVMQPFLLLWISYRYIHPTLLFYQEKLFIKFMLCIAVITAIFSVGLVSLCYPFLRTPVLSPPQLWFCWWLANFNGMVIFSVAIIAWDAYFPQTGSLLKKHTFLFISHFLFLFGSIIKLLLTETPSSVIKFTSLTCLIIAIIFLRYGQLGLIFAILLMGFLFGMSAYLDALIWMTSFSTQTLCYLQLMTTFICLIGLWLSVQMLKAKFSDLF